MGRKKKKNRHGPTSFKVGFDARRAVGKPSSLNAEELGRKKRYDPDLLKQACLNEGVKTVTSLPGVNLRPKLQSPNPEPQLDQSNDIVDLDLLNSAHADALKWHQKYIVRGCRRHAIKHVVSLSMQKKQNVGFGVTVAFKCSGCRFLSPTYKLYHTTKSGGCVTNAAAGAALTKVAIKASDASFLMSSLNVNGPSEKTYQRYVNDSCAVAGEILEDSLADNRGVAIDYLYIVGRVDDPKRPGCGVAVDGQFNRPIYHGYDGKSSSVSEPVLETETGLNMMVGHAVKSKWDGSYPVEKVVDCL